jgi:hypothetical protein
MRSGWIENFVLLLNNILAALWVCVNHLYVCISDATHPGALRDSSARRPPAAVPDSMRAARPPTGHMP